MTSIITPDTSVTETTAYYAHIEAAAEAIKEVDGIPLNLGNLAGYRMGIASIKEVDSPCHDQDTSKSSHIGCMGADRHSSTELGAPSHYRWLAHCKDSDGLLVYNEAIDYDEARKWPHP